MKSVFAARQQFWAGRRTKHDFNMVVAKWAFMKWVELSKQTEPTWRWLCELGCYLELKHHGLE